MAPVLPPPFDKEAHRDSKYNKQCSTSHHIYARTAKLQPVNYQGSIQRNRVSLGAQQFSPPIQPLLPRERQWPERLSSAALGLPSNTLEPFPTNGLKARGDWVGLDDHLPTWRRLPRSWSCLRMGSHKRTSDGGIFRLVKFYRERAPVSCSPPISERRRRKRHWPLWLLCRANRSVHIQPVRERRRGKTCRFPPRDCQKEEGQLRDPRGEHDREHQQEHSTRRMNM